MNAPAAFIYTPEFLHYRFSDSHPFNPLRLQITFELLTEAGLLSGPDLVEPRTAADEELLLVHSEEYIQAVRRAGSSDPVDFSELGQYDLGTEDVPVFEGMDLAAGITVGGTLTAVELVLEGKKKHAVNLAGGLHHAHRGSASGFCVFNDVAVAVALIRKKYDARVLYIDTDAHHCDGVQNIFYDDPDVMVISLHESGHYLFPGTGDIHERGTGDGYGSTINVPLEPFTEDDCWISAFNSVVIPNARMFAPDVIISQHGCDGHYFDPLTHLALTMKSYEMIPRGVHELAEQLCDGRLVVLGGGGYNVWQVVPRAWALLWCSISGRAIPAALPASWVEKCRRESGEEIPHTFCDPEDLVPVIARREEIKEKNQLTVNRVMRQSFSWF